MYCDYKNKKTTMIGFAETATAIASTVAIHCPDDVYYIHTSRETLPHSSVPNINILFIVLEHTIL